MPLSPPADTLRAMDHGQPEVPKRTLLTLMRSFAADPGHEMRTRLLEALGSGDPLLYIRSCRPFGERRRPLTANELVFETGPDGREVPGVKAFSNPGHPDLFRPSGSRDVRPLLVPAVDLLRCCDERGVLLLTIDHHEPHGTWLGRENWKDSPLIPIFRGKGGFRSYPPVITVEMEGSSRAKGVELN